MPHFEHFPSFLPITSGCIEQAYNCSASFVSAGLLTVAVSAGLFSTGVCSSVFFELELHAINTNADTIASVLAVALSKHFDVRLIFCFEKQGVLTDVNKEDSVIRNLNHDLYKELLTKGSFHDGILPKLENAFSAIQSGVKEVLIGEHTNLLANIGYDTKGTLITHS